MGILGILLGLLLLIALAFHSWSILLLAPAAALVSALFSGEPLLASWTQTFMGGTAHFLAQYFPLFLLGALFGKLMDDSGSVSAIADFMTQRFGTKHAILAVVLAGALVTYGGVSLFVAFFVLAPMSQSLFQAAAIPRRLMPAAIVLGTSTFTMSALPGTPSIQNAIPMPFLGTTPFAAPGLGIIASAVMLLFGMWWLKRAERLLPNPKANNLVMVLSLKSTILSIINLFASELPQLMNLIRQRLCMDFIVRIRLPLFLLFYQLSLLLVSIS